MARAKLTWGAVVVFVVALAGSTGYGATAGSPKAAKVTVHSYSFQGKVRFLLPAPIPRSQLTSPYPNGELAVNLVDAGGTGRIGQGVRLNPVYSGVNLIGFEGSYNLPYGALDGTRWKMTVDSLCYVTVRGKPTRYGFPYGKVSTSYLTANPSGVWPFLRYVVNFGTTTAYLRPR